MNAIKLAILLFLAVCVSTQAQTMYGDTITIDANLNHTAFRPGSDYDGDNVLVQSDSTYFNDPNAGDNLDLSTVAGFAFATDKNRSDTIRVEVPTLVDGDIFWRPIAVKNPVDGTTAYSYIVDEPGTTEGSISIRHGYCEIAEDLSGKGPIRVVRTSGALSPHSLLVTRIRKQGID